MELFSKLLNKKATKTIKRKLKENKGNRNF
jgi:hypothetical protein